MPGTQNFRDLLSPDHSITLPLPKEVAVPRTEASGAPRLTGVVALHPRGFGFVMVDSVEYFVPPSAARGLLPADLISFEAEPGRKPNTFQASNVLLVARKESVWVGKLERHGDRTLVVPDEPCLPALLLKLDLEFVAPDVIVSVRAMGHQGAPRKPSNTLPVRLERILGLPHRPGFDQHYALARYDFPMQFSSEVLAEAEQVAMQGVGAEHRACQHIPFVTIDGETTRDLDDAVWAEAKEGGWRVCVAIADVSFYVAAGTGLDADARRRGTSVYLPDKVVPMLPEVLSTGVCSLSAGVDRLAVVAELELDTQGEVISRSIYRGVIRSVAKLTYDQVQQARDGCSRQSLPEAFSNPGVQASLSALWSVREVLADARRAKGILDFENPEPRLVPTESGEKRLDWSGRLDAHKLVEELMLLANRAAAAELLARASGGLFRHQPAPEQEDWQELQNWAAGRNQVLPPTPDMTAAVSLTQVVAAEDRLKANLRVRGVMRPASYHQEDGNHFSLNFASYTHFTSPIRRYADLTVHRLLTGTSTLSPRDLQAESMHCSDRAKAARLAERMVWDNIKKSALWAHVQSTEPGALSGHVVSQSRRGLRVVVDNWQTSVLVSAEQAEASGLTYDVQNECWGKAGQLCELGTGVGVLVLGCDKTNPRIELAAKICTIA